MISPSISTIRHIIMGTSILILLLWHAGESGWIRPHYLAYFNPLDGGPRNGYRCLVDSSLDWGQDLPGLRDWLNEHNSADEPVYLSYFGSTNPRYYAIAASLLPGFIDWRPPPALVPPKPLQPGIYCLSATMLQVGFGICPGTWNQTYEERYQQCRNQLRNLSEIMPAGKLEESLSSETTEQWLTTINDFEWLRFGRLRAYLKRRAPDTNVGFSILIYPLTAADLKAALDDPLP